MPFSHLHVKSCPRNINELIAHVQESFAELPLDVCCKVLITAQIHESNSPTQRQQRLQAPAHRRAKKREGCWPQHFNEAALSGSKAVGHNISMRLPCRALIDDGALDCYYITTFLSNGKFIVVLTTSLCLRRLSSSFVVHHVVAVTVAVAVTIAVVHCAIAVAHNNDVVHPCHCLHLRCRRRHLPSPPSSSICAISIAIAVRRCRRRC